MIYLFTFILCLLADKFFEKKYKPVFYIAVIWLYIFLCFGYTTGSDWRNYELYYNGSIPINSLKDSEFGFVWLVKFCKVLIKDFWVFNGIMKMIYLHSLLKFFSKFTNKRLTAVALSFCWYTLFMLIDCPMRYMLGTIFILYATTFLLDKRWILSIVFIMISLTFHNMMIVSVIMAIATILIGKRLTKINSIVLIGIFIVCQIISTMSHYFDTLLLTMSMTDSFSGYADWYSEYTTQNYQTIGAIKNIVFFIVLILNRNLICSSPKGEYMFNGAYLYFTIGSILSMLPTGFRLAIFPGYFWVAAFTCIIYSIEYRKHILKRYIKYAFILLLGYQVISTVYSTYIYYPYTNSIPYILNEHIPYPIRSEYNIKEWDEEFRF